MNIYNFEKMAYKEFTYTCPLTISHPIPTHVSITTKPKCASSYSTLVPINFVPKQSPQFEFGVCVTNGYGSPPVDEFVEWMELLLLYGVSEVNLYDTHYENTTRMFSYYAERNVLSVRKLPHPLLWDAQWYRKVRNLRSVAFNDCMLRNMYRYRYLVVIDLDEMIVPRYHVNYSAVLDQVLIFFSFIVVFANNKYYWFQSHLSFFNVLPNGRFTSSIHFHKNPIFSS